jgi:hypothetical protein
MVDRERGYRLADARLAFGEWTRRVTLPRQDLAWRLLANLLLLLGVSWLLLPKLMVLDWAEDLWIDYGVWQTLTVLRQDLLVAAFAFVLLRSKLPDASRQGCLLWGAGLSLVLALLMLEARARQLWLRPVDPELIAYAWTNQSDLLSGLELFFNYSAGWETSFRRNLAWVMVTHVTFWLALAFCGRSVLASLAPPAPTSAPASQLRRLRLASYVPLLTVLPLALFAAGGERYRMAENVLVNPLLRWVAPGPHPQHDARPEDFDQSAKPAPARSFGLRRLLGDAPPFQNVILVFYESVRWLELELDRADAASPNLARLAREGLFSKCYVPVPHSSKAYYSVLTGRYPYPGIEMRETLPFSAPSFVRSILEHAPGTRGIALTSMHFAFENTGGLLQSLGLEERLDLETLSRRYGAVVEQRSSFGSDDAALYDLATRYLAERSGPFVAVLQPLGAHYPYEYPGKPRAQGSDYAAYRAALAYSDTLLGELVELLTERGLLKDTLLVVVGDHGEAFGEHGVYAHNSSLYFEETTVPLLFWSSDQRLRHPDLILSRQIDIGPTILDLLGIEDDTQPVQGRSLLRGGGLEPMYMSTFFDDLALGLVEPPYKFIYEPATQQLQRYDLVNDALDRHPAAVTGPEHESVVRRLRAFQAAQRAAFD